MRLVRQNGTQAKFNRWIYYSQHILPHAQNQKPERGKKILVNMYGQHDPFYQKSVLGSKLPVKITLTFFSRPNVRNGRAYGRLSSVRPSICHGCIVAKRCEIGPRLLLITNKKTQTGILMT